MRNADASVSASATGLSRRQRSIRGKRTATPLRWRLLTAMPSKPSSNTCVGVTLRTGPNVSTVVLRMIANQPRASPSRRGRNRPWRKGPVRAWVAPSSRIPKGERVVAVYARTAAVAALRVYQHGVDAHRIELPLPPDIHAVAALAPPHAIGALARFKHQPLATERARFACRIASIASQSFGRKPRGSPCSGGRPTFGEQTRPASASSFSRRSRCGSGANVHGRRSSSRS